MDISHPRLNYDVLESIISHSAHDTILTIMRTCQALYSRGASYVLKALNFIYIDGKFDRGVLSFLSFMEAEQGRRWSYVRVIRIAGTVDSYDVAGQLAAALRHANNLRKLVLCYAESFLGMHADLAPALESLTTIEELEAHDVGSRVSALLQYAKWPLRRVRLDRIHMDDGSQSSGTTNPAFLLKNAQSTLTELVCARWLWFKEWLPTYPTYPNLRLFCISQYDDVPVSFWIQAYPNVTSLSTRLPDDFCGEMVGARLDSFMATRDNNQKCITALGKRCWQVLDQHSSSCITGLYLLAIPCRVRRIYLSRMDPRDMQFLPDVMAFARPEELEVDVYDLSLTPKLARSLQEYLKRAEDSLADLRVFHLPGVWLGGGLGSSVSDTLAAVILPWLRHLRGLRSLVVRAQNQRSQSPWHDDREGIYMTPTMIDVRRHMSPFLELAFSTLPSLEEVKVVVVVLPVSLKEYVFSRLEHQAKAP